jgi:trk system potassium uptake protein
MNVIIVGGGEVGAYLAALLLKGGHKVKVIEVSAETIKHLAQEMPEETLVLGSGTDPGILESAGIRNIDVLAAVADVDETNLASTCLARFAYHVPRTIARVNNPKNDWMFTPTMGVDVALNQADLMGHLIAEEMSLGDMVTLLKLRKGLFSLVEEKVHPTAAAAGKAVGELNLPDQCILTAVIRKGQLLIPRIDLVLQPADELLVLAHASQVNQVAALLGRSR